MEISRGGRTSGQDRGAGWFAGGKGLGALNIAADPGREKAPPIPLNLPYGAATPQSCKTPSLVYLPLEQF